MAEDKNVQDVAEENAAEETMNQEADVTAEDMAETEAQGNDVTAEESEADAEDAGDKSDKKSHKKKDKKDKKDEKIEELNDRLMRNMAEFENFRKRTEKEKAQMFDMGAKTIIEKILPVVDNFERGLAAVPEDQREDGFVAGMDKIYRQMVTELEAAGVTPIECVGTEFNPEFHNAVMQVESEEFESGMVAAELLKGYMYKDTVVRHSMVSVVS